MTDPSLHVWTGDKWESAAGIAEERDRLKHEVPRLRFLLAQAVDMGPRYDPVGAVMLCCGTPAFQPHKPDCWLLAASQYLQEHPAT